MSVDSRADGIPSVGALLLLDAVTLAFFSLVVGPAAALTTVLHQHLAVGFSPAAQWLLLPVDAVAFLLAMAAALLAVRLCLPRLREGVFTLSGAPQTRAWGMHFALMRVAYLPLWQPFVFGFATLRWCFLSALGAKVPLRLATSSDAAVLDPSLVTVGEGAMLAAGVVIAGHLVEEGKLKLAPVTIGPGAQLLSGVMVAPGVSIGTDTHIGPMSYLGPEAQIGDDCHLGLMAQVAGGVRIGNNVVLGHRVRLEPGVVLGDGVVVLSDVQVPKNTQIPAGGRFPPRGPKKDP